MALIPVALALWEWLYAEILISAKFKNYLNQKFANLKIEKKKFYKEIGAQNFLNIRIRNFSKKDYVT